jgi:hypothetical protein
MVFLERTILKGISHFAIYEITNPKTDSHSGGNEEDKAKTENESVESHEKREMGEIGQGSVQVDDDDDADNNITEKAKRENETKRHEDGGERREENHEETDEKEGEKRERMRERVLCGHFISLPSKNTFKVTGRKAANPPTLHQCCIPSPSTFSSSPLSSSSTNSLNDHDHNHTHSINNINNTSETTFWDITIHSTPTPVLFTNIQQGAIGSFSLSSEHNDWVVKPIPTSVQQPLLDTPVLHFSTTLLKVKKY